MKSRFQVLALWITRHKWMVLFFWLFLLASGTVGTTQLPGRLLGGSGSIEGSDSHRVEMVLQNEFGNPFSRSLVAVIHSPRYTVESAVYQGWLAEIEKTLTDSSEVKAVATWAQQKSLDLRSPDGHGTLVMIGLDAETREAEELQVPVLRRLLEPHLKSMQREDQGARIALIGAAAISYDLNQASQKDARNTEIWTLPITAVILLVAFGTPIAAGLPLFSGVTSTIVSWGLAFLLTFLMPLSHLIGNIATMIGLAVGIDYALLTVSRFREEERSGGRLDEVIARTIGHTGPAILYSGLTVMIGLAGLVLSPLMETRSIGLGGAVVVLVSVLAAITLQPALLALFGKWLNRPQWMARPLVQSPRARMRWEKLALGVMSRPWTVFICAILILGVVAHPVLRLRLGYPSGDWMPRSTQSGEGFDLIKSMGMSNQLFPIQVTVRSPDGGPLLPDHIPALLSLTQTLNDDPQIGNVVSPVMMLADGHQDPGSANEMAGKMDWFVSKDRTAALFQIFPSPDLNDREVSALASKIKTLDISPLAKPEVGGQSVYYNDMDTSVLATYPMILTLVVGATLVVLFLAYRSYLLPVKAVLMNLLSVAAGCGLVVAVFQEGWCGDFFALREPLGAIPVYVPLIIFCIMFGLSMDYEVFLISRIKEAYDRTGDNTLATAEGLAATGSIITQAALVMVAVFGASAWAKVVVVQMIGLGLAVTVLVDATLIRVLLVPAFMRLAGQWNWYPGSKADKGS